MGNDGLPAPLTEQAGTVTDVWHLFFPLAIGVAALVALLMLYVMIRFRRRAGDSGLPKQTRERLGIEAVYTTIPLAVVIGLFALTVQTINRIDAVDPDPDLTVDVVGFQWQWQFSYPDAGVTVVGDSVDDPPELVLPAGSTVRFNLSSRDVIHSFWVPGFLFKRDAIPGSPTSFDVHVADQPGFYPNGVCAEFCGLYHTRMTFSIRIVSRDDFDRWLAEEGGPS